jgi:putative radical SAM enzyme (TIGR03279 family)
LSLALVPPPSAPKGVLPGTIQTVEPGTPAHALGIRPGDRLVTIDGHPLRDVIDYRFYSSGERIALTLERGGRQWQEVVEKDPDEPLGLDFGVALFDDIIRCNNNCYFCFIGGNRKEMRRSLFIKDDDYRLSFLFGNFVTLTNLTDEDWARIEEQRLSPLYVSVHATELDLRRKLLANKTAGDVLEQIDRLSGLGIRVHCQLVVCPQINDGPHLDRSVEDLASRYPYVQSIAAVPVGLTELNQVRGAFKLKRPSVEEQVCTPAYAEAILDQLAPYQRRYQKSFDTPLIYASDEYYLAAGRPVPSARHYGDYAQFENGVGMVRWLIEDWRKTKRKLTNHVGQAPSPVRGARRLTLVCGTLIAPTLQQICDDAAETTGITLDLLPVANDTFGPSINCSGLLTGRDIMAALEGRDLGDEIILPRCALDDAGDVFLDDVTPAQMQERLKRTVRYVKAVSELFC